MKKKGLLFAGFWLAALSAQHAPAQNNTSGTPLLTVDRNSKHFSAPRTASEPQIDGVVDGEAAWQNARLITDFYQVEPNEYLPATEKTEFLVMYDDNNLYIAGRVYYQDKSEITANVLRQGDSTRFDDRIAITLDPFGDARRGYLFIVNPHSVRSDGIYVGTSTFQADWDGIWEARASFTDYGWSGEMKIPFKTLSFDANADVWGINLWRAFEIRSERIGWYSQNQETNPGAAGTMTALKGINQGMGLDLVPSLSLVERKNNQSGESNTEFEPSLDAFYKITPSLNAAITLNTDFSATEVDDRQVDLTQFSLFFPEKREFFLRDFDIFDFGNIGKTEERTFFFGSQRENARPFFSRKIGLSRSGEPIGIDGGAKISGELAGLNVGGLVMRQEAFGELEETDLFVGRLTRDVLEESSIGVIYTNGDPASNADNNLIGADFRYRNTRLGRGRSLAVDLWYQQTDSGVDQDDEYAFGAKLSVPSSVGWGGTLQYQEVGENYNPALGFAARRGVRMKRVQIFHNTRYADRFLRRVNPSMEYIEWEYLDTGRTQSAIVDFKLIDLESRNGDRIWALGSPRWASIRGPQDQPLQSVNITMPDGDYDWTRWAVGVDTGKHRKVVFTGRLFTGSYYNGDRTNFFGDINWRPSYHYNFNVGWDYSFIDLPDGKFISRLLDFKAEWVFSSTLSWANLVQYDNVSENLGFNSRLHWVPKAGQDLYLVFNKGWQDVDRDNHFDETEQDLTLKVSYTFRF